MSDLDHPVGGPPNISEPIGSRSQPNTLRHYAAVLRRRWIWIVLGVAVGLLAGAASTLLLKEERDPNHYYKATNTLIANGATSGQGGGGIVPNLQQAAYLVHSADVVSQVATELNLDPTKVNDQVSAIARSDVNSIDVTAISMDPAEAVVLADTTAKVLNNYVTNADEATYATQRDQVLAELDELKQQRTDLEAKIAANPNGSELERTDLEALYTQYRAKTEELTTLSSQSGPDGGMSTLQTAAAIEINGGAYSKRRNENINSRGGPDQPSVASTASSGAETDLSSGPPVSKPLRILIGGVAGLVMGLATAFLVEAWDDRVRKRERVEELTGLTVIAEVPKFTKEHRNNTDVISVDSPRSNAAERYRAVKTAILFTQHEHLGQAGITETGIDWGGRPTPVIMIGSPNPSEGKTTTVANVAAVFGSSGIRTLVIDCDYHKPSIAKYLAPVPDLDDPDSPAITRLDGVWFMPAPRLSTSADAILQIRRTIATWRDQFDLVLLDTPPILSTNDATDLIPAADSVVIVLRAGQTRTGPAERVANVLARYRAEVLGVILNGVDSAEMESYYGYAYGYNDESRTRNQSPNGTTVATDARPAPVKGSAGKSA